MPKQVSAALLALVLPVFAFAAGDHTGHDMKGHSMEQMMASSIGQPGKAANVTRTIDIELGDDMRFKPDRVDVKKGETVRFFVRNAGQIEHEMVLGNVDELKEHAKMMRAMPDMSHEEPNMVKLKPGQRGALIWQFTQTGAVTFACTVPGHLEAGMVGTIAVAQ